MDLFEEIKFTLKEREGQIRTLDKSNEEITSLCRTLIDCVKQTMRNRPDGLDYDEKQLLTKHTKDLCSRIDEVEVKEEVDEVVTQDYELSD